MKKAKNHLCLLAICLFAAQMNAQNTATLKGIVVDDTQKPLPSATLSLLNAADSVIVKVALADSVGQFVFEPLAPKAYILMVSFVGFKNYYTPLSISAAQVLDLKTISLEPSTLQTVTVSGKKPFVEQKIDRTVVNPDALIANAGLTALDVLEKAPSIAVDMNGIISLRGKNGVMVFIDDKPTNLAPADLANYLRSLQSNTIESIEIMPNPPAKYDAAGNAGIINIRLKKNTVKGVNGSVSLAYGQGFYHRTNNSFNFNYRKNKVNFFSTANYNINNSYQDLTINRKYFKPNNELMTAFNQRGWLKIQTGSINARAGVDYYPNKKTTVGFVVNGFVNPVRRITNNFATLRNGTNTIDSTLQSRADRDGNWYNGSMNLNATRKIGAKGKEINANIDLIKYRLDAVSNLTNQVFLPNGTKSTFDELLGDIPATIDIQTAKVDYAQPIKGGNFEAGTKVSFIQTDNTADYFDVINGNKRPNYLFSNRFIYQENIAAAYLNFNKEMGKFGIQGGLRYEYTLSVGDQKGNPLVKDSTFRRPYGELFPTFYATYRIDSVGKHLVQLNYGRRINRPDYQALNPFTYPLDKFTLYSGNPFLRPTFAHNIELSYIFDSWLSATLYYSYEVDNISETIRNEGYFFSRPGNIGNNITSGLIINAGRPLTKWWQFNGTGQLLNIKSTGNVFGNDLSNQGTFWRIQATNQLKINKLWSAEFGGIYTSEINSGQFVIIPQWNTNAGVQVKVLKEKGAIKLAVSDLFHRYRPGGNIIAIGNTEANWLSILDTRVATLTFTYRFNKGQNLKVRTNNAAESERNRVKTN